MDQSHSAMAQQIAQAASASEQRRTGRVPQSVTVVLGGDTLVVTLHGALSPAEVTLGRSPAGAVRLQDYHRQLFANSADGLRQEIKRITGAEVRQATMKVEALTGAVLQMLPTGAVVQVFLLAANVPGGTWSGKGPGASG